MTWRSDLRFRVAVALAAEQHGHPVCPFCGGSAIEMHENYHHAHGGNKRDSDDETYINKNTCILVCNKCHADQVPKMSVAYMIGLRRGQVNDLAAFDEAQRAFARTLRCPRSWGIPEEYIGQEDV